LASSKRTAQKAQCLNNLKELGTADIMYVADNKVFIQPSSSVYLGVNSQWMGPMMDNMSRGTNVLLCPTASAPPLPSVISQYSLNTSVGTGNISGTSDGCYVDGTLNGGSSGLSAISTSYTANGWLYVNSAGAGGGDGSKYIEPANSIPDPQWYYVSEASLNNPANTPMFLDGPWVDAWPAENDSPSHNLYTGVLGQNNMGHTSEMSRITMARHGINPGIADRSHTKPWQSAPPVGGINYVFADGHAEYNRLTLAMWNYNWHRSWGTKNKVSPGLPIP
jgi:prepilin-type processing-associated H-X9-DG protein